MIDFSNTQVKDKDILRLSESKTLYKLEIIKLNHCEFLSEESLNGLILKGEKLFSLTLIEFKGKIVNLLLL